MSADAAVLTQILKQLETLQVSQQAMQAKVRVRSACLSNRFAKMNGSQLDNFTQHQPVSSPSSAPTSPQRGGIPLPRGQSDTPPMGSPASSFSNHSLLSTLANASAPSSSDKTLVADREREKLLYPGRVLLTSACTCNVSYNGYLC